MNIITLERPFETIDDVDHARRAERIGGELVPSAESVPAGAVTTTCGPAAAEAAPPRRWRLFRRYPGRGAEHSARGGWEGEAVKWTPLVALPDFHIPILLTRATEVDRALFARRLHNLGPRRHGPFVTVRCRGRHPDEIDLALFGDALGGAAEEGDPDGGAVVAATGGTLYLDEVSRLSLFTQAKLLHAIERRRHPGAPSTGGRPLDFRLIVATTVNLPEEVRRGRFRASLLFAIAGLALWVPRMAPRTEPLDAPPLKRIA